MRKKLFTVSASLLLAAVTLAQSNMSMVGTWKLDTAQSDFVADPTPKSGSITFLKDAPQMLSWRVREVDDKGKVEAYSWSGPQDGTLHPLMQNGKEAAKESIKKDGDRAVVRRVELPDGTSFDSHATLAPDGNSFTDELTMTSKDGKQSKQKLIYHRVKAVHKSADAKTAS